MVKAYRNGGCFDKNVCLNRRKDGFLDISGYPNKYFGRHLLASSQMFVQTETFSQNFSNGLWKYELLYDN